MIYSANSPVSTIRVPALFTDSILIKLYPNHTHQLTRDVIHNTQHHRANSCGDGQEVNLYYVEENVCFVRFTLKQILYRTL
jgi:hypothetical protein